MFRWTFLTTLAWALWVAIACTPLAIVDSAVPPTFDENWEVYFAAMTMLLGALIGGSQWLLLRHHVPTANAWPVVTIVGAGIGGGLLGLLGPYDSYGVIPGVIVLYVVTGILQGLVLSREAAQIIAWMSVMFITSLLVIYVGTLFAILVTYVVDNLLGPWDWSVESVLNPASSIGASIILALPFGLVYALVTGWFIRPYVYPVVETPQTEPTGAQ